MSSATYLNELKLSKYVDIFDDWGAENPDSIEDMDVDALIAEFDMKKGHAKLLRKWLDKRAGDDPPHSHSRTASIVSARGANVWDFFLSHYQAESGDLVALVATKLEHRGFRIWYDKWPGKGDAASGFIDVTKDGMKLGVERSAVFVLFLSKGVFTRPFCRLEIITALKEGRPIITLMETDTRHGAFNFGDAAKDGVPSAFHPIIDLITSGVMAIPLRRDVEEQDLMLDKIGRVFVEGRAKVLVVADAVIAAAVAADEPQSAGETSRVPPLPPAAAGAEDEAAAADAADELQSSEQGVLPSGWAAESDGSGGTYYYDKSSRRATWTMPPTRECSRDGTLQSFDEGDEVAEAGEEEGIRVLGHVGAQSGRMGEYTLDAVHSPKRGKNVYSLMVASGVHLYHATDDAWCISDTEDMVAGKSTAWIASTTPSSSPLGLKWQAYDGTAYHLDSLLKVTAMSAAELAVARATAEAETQRGLAIHALRFAGHTGGASFAMGAYARDAGHSPKRGKNVYSQVDATSVHLYEATSGVWCIGDTEDMVSGATSSWIRSLAASPSPLGLEWNKEGIVVTEMSAAELAAARAAAEAETQRILAICAVCVSGHVGKQGDKMGVYALDAAHSPKRGKNVYSQEGASDVHLFQAVDEKWQIGDTEDMVSGENEGIIESTTASPSLLGLTWKYADDVSDDGDSDDGDDDNDDDTVFHLDPLLTVTEMSATELTTARAEAEAQRSLIIRAVRVSGHVGVMSDEMGVYALDAAHSKRGKNVYSLEGKSGVHLYQATDGIWYIAPTEQMLAGKADGWIASTTASPSPLGLAWKADDGTTWQLDPRLMVTET